jgi:serine/threonine-protein kinase
MLSAGRVFAGYRVERLLGAGGMGTVYLARDPDLPRGRTPFATTNGSAAVMAAHLHAPPPSVTDVAPGLSTQMDEVIAVAMAKDPAQRFGSARSLTEAALAALNDQTVQFTAPWQPIPSAQATSFQPPPLAPPIAPTMPAPCTGRLSSPRRPSDAAAGASRRWPVLSPSSPLRRWLS